MFDRYLKIFFCEKAFIKNKETKLISEKQNNSFITVIKKDNMYGKITLDQLPVELLRTCQSFGMLNDLRHNINTKYKKMISDIETGIMDIKRII